MKSHLVSVIITTKNEEKNIANCLDSILQQTYPQKLIEIIVVDNSSTDKTKEIAKSYSKKMNIQIFNKGPERSAQRNYGVDKSKGEYILYLDADMTLSKNILNECVEKIGSNKYIGLYIPLRWVGKNWIIKAKGFEREFYDGTCLDAVRFVNKKSFQTVGGFDTNLYAAEDWDLDKKIRQIGNVGIINSIMLHNEDDSINLSEYTNKMNYYSKNLVVYINKWGQNDSEIKKQFGFIYRGLIVFIEKGKWRKVISHPIMTFQMYFLKIIALTVFQLKKKQLIN